MTILVVVVLMVIAFSVGCAKYDGNKAAFCAGLAKAPSFSDLAIQGASGSTSGAAEKLDRAAETFRALERSAPRTIRIDVATLGDSAERIAGRLRDASSPESSRLPIRQPDGSTLQVPVPNADGNRYTMFYNELMEHPGTISAIRKLGIYAQRDCGIPSGSADLGLTGLGNPVEPLMPTTGLPSASTVVPPNDLVPVTPPPGHTLPPTVILPNGDTVTSTIPGGR